MNRELIKMTMNRLIKDFGRFPRRKERSRLGENGQIVIEYVLLLVVAVTLATLITRMMVGREQGNEGFVIRAWQTLITQIGADHADGPETKSKK